MTKKDFDSIMRITAYLTIISAAAYISLTNSTFNLVTVSRSASSAFTIVSVFWWFYFKWGWKLKIFSWILYRPNLNGTWSGTLESDFMKDGVRIPIKQFHIVVRHSFLTLHVKTYTESYTGVSYVEAIKFKEAVGLKKLVYLYRQETSQNLESASQLGGAELELLGPDLKRLAGKYWTNTKTQGEIKLEFVSDKQVDSFEDAVNLRNNGK